MDQSAPHKSSRKKGIILFASILLLFFALVALIGGALVLYFNTGTDPEGYTLSEKYQVRTTANAFALSLGPIRRDSSWYSLFGMENIAQTKWVITSIDSNKEIFAGWTIDANSTSYVNSFGIEVPDQYWRWQVRAYYAKIEIPATIIRNQGSPSQLPSELTFWTKTTSTKTASTLYWDPHWDPTTGYYMLVIMNADGSSNVNADLQLGFKVPILGWLPYLLFPLGIILLIAGILLLRMRK